MAISLIDKAIPLVTRSRQVVSFTDLARNGADLFSKVASQSERLLVVRKSVPVAVVLNVEEYENMLDQMESLNSRLDAYERERVINGDSDPQVKMIFPET